MIDSNGIPKMRMPKGRQRKLLAVDEELRAAKTAGDTSEIEDLRTIRSQLIHGFGCRSTPQESAAHRRQGCRRSRRRVDSGELITLSAQESCQLPPKSAEMGAAPPETVPVEVADRLYEAFRAYVDGLSDTETARAALNAYVLAAPE